MIQIGRTDHLQISEERMRDLFTRIVATSKDGDLKNYNKDPHWISMYTSGHRPRTRNKQTATKAGRGVPVT